MPKPNFSKVGLEGTAALAQHNTERGLRELPGALITQGRLLESIEVTTAGLRVAHLLGRKPRGWFPVDKNADARVWRTNWDDKFLYLDSSATITINIWVF